MQCRIAPSLGALEGHPNDVWGTTDYVSQDEPTVFFGLYGLPDFYALWRHKGPKYILWAGSDIRHFVQGYFLQDDGRTRLAVRPLARWIIENCESYVENQVEYEALKRFGIESKICPSFLGNIEEYPLAYTKSEVTRLYTSVSGNDFKLYGWDKIPDLAKKNPDTEFHLYGNTKEPPFALADHTNIVLHGRVPKEQMNEEIKHMSGALRLTEFDGFSEIIAKSLLWGQWPVSSIRYAHTIQPRNIHGIKHLPLSNVSGRDYYRSILNQYPWCKPT